MLKLLAHLHYEDRYNDVYNIDVIVVVNLTQYSSKENFGVGFSICNSRTRGIYIVEPNQWPFIGLEVFLWRQRFC